MKNDNRKSLSLYRELFNRATWGGAWGGGSLVTAMEVEGYSSFSWKTHIFEATEGASMGAHGGAQKWWGEWGGAPNTCKPFCSGKNEIFAMRNLIEIRVAAAPHVVTYKILKYDLSTLSGIKNHNFWTNTHVFMFT